jgi:hypothetical protein
MVGYTLATLTEGGTGGTLKLFAPSSKNESLTSIESIYKCGPNTTKGSILFPELFLIMPVIFFSQQEWCPLVNPQTYPRQRKIYRLNADGSIPKDNPCRSSYQRSDLHLW